MIGKRLNGRYKILQTIGGGGMANVYLAHDMILDRDVAVKVLRLDYVSENDLLKRFQREAQSATSLTHPNIVNMYDVGDEGEIYYLVMEYVDGMTLKEYIQKHSPVSLDRAIDIMLQLTNAISHAHHNGIIHRDIKPQNILVDRDGTIKITDFGIAMALSATSITQTNSVMGTVHYLSPEQARGGMATKKSDIYSLGIVMFELITGRLPFEGESAVSIALKHLQSDIPPPSKWCDNLPQSVENVILKATAKDAFYRYQSADELVDDLKTVLEPSRLNEPVFTIEPDDQATRAIPVIKEDRVLPDLQETKVPEKKPASSIKEDEPIKKKDRKKRKKWPWIVALMVLLLAAGTAVMAAMGMFGPRQVVVPDFAGVTQDEAEDELIELGLVVGEITVEPNEEVPEDEIVKTTPRAGRTVDEGTEIALFVSSGKETVTVDDYEGRVFEELEPLLEEIGYEVEVETEFSDQPQGTVIEQSPRPGEEVIPGETTMSLTVSDGLEVASVEDLTGLTLEEAAAFEERTGLRVNMTREEFDEAEEGVIISQNPEAGSELEVGSSVNVVVSRGPEPSTPNTVIVPITIDYVPQEPDVPEGEEPPDEPVEETEPVPQEIEIYIDDRDRNGEEPFEEFTITETTERTLRLVIEEGESGSYRVVRDGETIIDQTIPYDENEET